MAWERFTKKDGRKDVRPMGAPSDAVVVKNDAYRKAKRLAVQEEKRQAALSDFARAFGQNERALRAKSGPVQPSAIDKAAAEVNRLVGGSGPFKGLKP